MRPGLVSVTFRQLSPREIVSLAAQCGLEGIEWGGDVHVTDLATAGEVRRMTEDAGLKIAAFGSYWRSEGEFESALEIAVELGAPTIRVWAGTKGSAEAERTESIDSLRAACVLAMDSGKTISLEYHGGTLTDTLDSTLRLAREVDHPALRLYWQPVPERSHSERLTEVRAVLPLLSNLHVFQWTRSSRGVTRHPLDEGRTEWLDYLTAAQGERYALLEFVPDDDPSRLPRETETLREWLRTIHLTKAA